MDIEDISSNKQDNGLKSFIKDLIENIGQTDLKPSTSDIEEIYTILRRKYKLLPTKKQMRITYYNHFKDTPINNELKRYFIKRVMRSESGVIVFTIVTKPGSNIKWSCPEKCSYCPTETDLNGNPTQPKSYVSTEPAMLRATQNNFDIRNQILDRVNAYLHTGNLKNDLNKKKCEVILSGGTWDVMPKDYRDQVINEVYHTFNTISGDERPMLSINEEKKINQTSVFGIIGLTIETRPDYVTNKTLIEYLEYGITRVQLGGQSTHDDILLKIKRGCTVKNIIKTIRMLKGIGMKVVTHWMPDLPGSSPEKDMEMFNRLNTDPDLQSDDWKIYPCAVIKSASDDLIINSEINQWYDEGTYVQYAETNINDLINVLIKAKENVNPWLRIERLIRDFPSQSIESGYHKITNLRQLIKNKMTKENTFCKCIRCMEIKDRSDLINNGKIVVRKYEASQGIEYHISYEIEKYYWTFSYIIFCILYFFNKIIGNTVYYSGNNKLYSGLFGFLRLRIDPNPGLGIVSELEGCGLIREVHVYGMSTSVNLSNNETIDTHNKSAQHKGIGQQLINVAEEIVKSHQLNKVAVIAGIGAREYYKNKCDYLLDKYYMIKNV